MHRRSINRFAASDNESGSVITLSCFVAVVLLAVIGLAVDAGNLYRAKIALQKSADAAAYATVSYVIREGTQNVYHDAFAAAGIATDANSAAKGTALTEYLRPYARNVALSNMAAANLPDDPAANRGVTVETSYVPFEDPNPNVYRYDVTVRRSIDFFLMDLIPTWAGGTLSHSAELSASASVNRKVIWSVMFLDASRSMGCPAEGPCTCMGKDRAVGENCPVNGTKFDALLDAVQAYVETFDVERDKLIFVPFNIRSEAITGPEAQNRFLEMTGILGSPSSSLVGLIRAAYAPSSMTNICDAFIEGFGKVKEMLDAQAVPGNERIEYVLFTDGAPTAGRYFFNDIKANAGLPNWPPNSSTYDYVFHNIDWVNKSNVSNVGPSLLSQHAAYPIQQPAGSSSITPPPANSSEAQEYNPLGAAQVTCPGSPSSAPPVGNETDKRNGSNAVFGSCLNSMRFSIPNFPNRSFAGEYAAPAGAGTPSFRDFAELHYICSLSMADAMRDGPYQSTRGRGRFSVIGVGDPAPATANAFQNAEESETRHDVFLSRLALDKKQFDSIPAYQQAQSDPPEFEYGGYSSFDSLSSSANYEEVAGKYYPQPNIGELRNLFRTIARKTALRYIA